MIAVRNLTKRYADELAVSDPQLQRTARLDARLGGFLLTLAGAMILMGIISAETQYPAGRHYSTFSNEISDLGATLPPHSTITQPSAHIFDWTMLVAGAMLIAAAVGLHHVHRLRSLSAAIALMGCDVLGVGLFPDNHHTIHEASSLPAFFFGGLATTLSFRASHNPFRTLAFLLGLTSLFFLFAGHWILRSTLGPGRHRALGRLPNRAVDGWLRRLCSGSAAQVKHRCRITKPSALVHARCVIVPRSQQREHRAFVERGLRGGSGQDSADAAAPHGSDDRDPDDLTHPIHHRGPGGGADHFAIHDPRDRRATPPGEFRLARGRLTEGQACNRERRPGERRGSLNPRQVDVPGVEPLNARTRHHPEPTLAGET